MTACFLLQVAYHGAPEKAYEVFISSLVSKSYKGVELQDQNPAGIYIINTTVIIGNIFLVVDVIMDMLGNPKLRKIILEYYEISDEPAGVRKAVEESIHTEQSTRGLLRNALLGAKKVNILD